MPQAVVCVSSARGYTEQLEMVDLVKKCGVYSRPGSSCEGARWKEQTSLWYILC